MIRRRRAADATVPARRRWERVPARGLLRRRRRGSVLITALVAVIVIAVAAVAATHFTGDSGPADDARTTATPAYDDDTGITVRRVDYLPAGTGDPRQNYGDLYLPAGDHDVGSVPLVVLVHGGSWVSNYGASTFDALARTLAARGLAAYNIEYRRLGSGGGWPTTFTDVAAALDHVPDLEHLAPEIDASDTTLVGHSAGAQLAVWAGTRARPFEAPGAGFPAATPWRPSRIVALAGPLNMTLGADTGDRRITRVLGGTPKQVPDRYRAVDPTANIDPAMPIIVVHGTVDTVVSPTQSISFVAADKRVGGDARLVLLRGQSHSALVSAGSSAFPQVIDIIVAATRRSP